MTLLLLPAAFSLVLSPQSVFSLPTESLLLEQHVISSSVASSLLDSSFGASLPFSSRQDSSTRKPRLTSLAVLFFGSFVSSLVIGGGLAGGLSEAFLVGHFMTTYLNDNLTIPILCSLTLKALSSLLGVDLH